MKETKAPHCTINPNRKIQQIDQKLVHKQEITI